MVKTDYLIAGAGLSGATLAERLASHGHDVTIIDRRHHVAGNAYDRKDAHGILVHEYGPHIFHTNSAEVFSYLSRFTAWRPYEHRVLAVIDNEFYPIPINQTTINKLYGLDLDEDGMRWYYDEVRIPIEQIRNSEDVVLNAVGRDLFEKFYAGYTRKQWGVEASQLKAGVTARIPVRTDADDRYFTDKYQAMPADGYTRMVENMLSHPNITVELGIDYRDARKTIDPEYTIYTGPVDEYFDYRYGRLPYRSLRFEHEHLAVVQQYQPVGTVNYPNDHEYTRITEFKHLTGQDARGTSIVREYPQATGDPYYPVPSDENETLYRRYKDLADAEPNTYFTGRLARYKYYNMDQVVAAALKTAENILSKLA